MRYITIPMITGLTLSCYLMAFGQQVTTVPGQDGKTYERSSDGKLWLVIGGKDRREVDRGVKAIAPTGKGEVYVLGTDGKLWRGTGGEGHRREVDRGVRAIVPTGKGEVYVLGTDGKLWRGTCEEGGRREVGRSVVAIAPAGKGQVYVLDSDGKLWRGTSAEGRHEVGQPDVIGQAKSKPPFDVDIPFELFRRLLPNDGDAIAVWKPGLPGAPAPREAWAREKDVKQRKEYGEIAFGRCIRSHPNDRNDREQPWLRPGLIARNGYIEMKAGWRVKIDGFPGSPHYDGLIRAKLYLKVEKGKVKARLDDVKVTHRGSNAFITFANLFGAKIDIAGMIKNEIEKESTKVLGLLNDEIDKFVNRYPELRQSREMISIDLIEAPQASLLDSERAQTMLGIVIDPALLDRPRAHLGVVRITVNAKP